MVAKVFQNVTDIIDNYSGLSRKVLQYAVTTKELNEACKQPGFTDDIWDKHFSEFLDTENFLRIGHLKEEMDYPSYLEFQTKWAPKSYWECSFKRISEVDNVVILELEERVQFDDFKNSVNTVSIYEFNEAGKVTHLDLYLQQAPQSPDDIPDNYK